MTAESEYVFRVRWYQRALHEYLVNGGTRAIEIAHRRWGKDEIVLNATRDNALQRVGSYWHCLPEYEQARKAIWTSVNPHTGKRRIDEAFPPEIRDTKDEQQMFIRFKNGSTWQVIGSDRYNSLVGAGVCGVAFSEWALANPSAWAYIRPMLEENNGWAAFITTPRGRNHAHAMYEHARKSGRWFAEISPVTHTGALTSEQLDEARAEYVALYGEDLGNAQFEQEYLCSFDAAILGAYYGAEIRAMEAAGRLTEVAPDPSLPVHTVWDIGYTDDTCIAFFQVVAGEVRIFDAYASHSHGVEHYADLLCQRMEEGGYRFGQHWLPHDAQAKLFAAGGRSVIEQLNAHRLPGEINVLMNRQTEQQGILAARVMFPRLWVDGERCADMMDALRNFRREWDDDRKCFRDQPVKDWTNHWADVIRYLAWVWREPKVAPKEEQPRWAPTFNEMVARNKRRRLSGRA